MGEKCLDIGPDWRRAQVFLASRKHRGSDLAASATNVRRKMQL